MRCPFCDVEGQRQELHTHLVETHADAVEMWTDAASGRMHYRIACPVCGAGYEHRVKPRWTDPGFLDTFATEIRMVALDMLLNHVAGEHGAEEDAGADVAEPRRVADLPAAGPGGGRSRPGSEGVPLPPGMPAPAPPRFPAGDRLRVVHDPGKREEAP